MAFIDTDRLIESQHRAISCAEIVEKWGEKAFRAWESEIIVSLKLQKNSVIALGGGALMESQNRVVISSLGMLVYLYVEKEELKRRLLQTPLSQIKTEAAFEEMYGKRTEQYESLSHVKISLGTLSTEEVLQTIEERWAAIHLV